MNTYSHLAGVLAYLIIIGLCLAELWVLSSRGRDGEDEGDRK